MYMYIPTLVPVPFSMLNDTNYAYVVWLYYLVLYKYVIIKTPAVANIIVLCMCVTVIKI